MKTRFMSGWVGYRVWLLCALIALAGGCDRPPPSGGGATAPRPMSRAEVEQALARFSAGIPVTKAPVGQVEVVVPDAKSLADTLPDIANFKLVVNPAHDEHSVVAEVFASLDKSGPGRDGWMVEVAQLFNAAKQMLAGGKEARIALRAIDSGTGYEFIASVKYRPAGYSPAGALWGDMCRAQGVEIDLVAERLAGDVAGMVMKPAVAERLKAGKSEIQVTDVVDAAIRGKLTLGYPNPFSSTTGLNFLVTVLQTLAQGDESAMLSPAVTSAFEQFQKGVPFVAMNSLQLRDSVERDGSLDAFATHHGVFAQSPALQSAYVFIPFGLRHDNPLFAVSPLSPESREVLERFASFIQGPESQALVTRYGYNSTLDWTPPYPAPAGTTATEAQRLWKKTKEGGRPVAAVFVADVSGSMAGNKIKQLRQALIDGGGFIVPENAIGLVTFDSQVTIQLPIQPFEKSHKAAFDAAARRLEPGSATAMYDGLVVALKLLEDYQRANPDVRPRLFVLTDGQTNQGLTFDQVRGVIAGLGVPTYTIGFDADIAELARLSALVEAASFNASEADLSYKLAALLNAQM